MERRAMNTAPDGTVTGNHYDKYGTRNPIARLLMKGFEENLDGLFTRAAPTSLLDIGCGEGVWTHAWALRMGEGSRVVGLDLEDARLRAEWAKRSASNLEFRVRPDGPLPFGDDAFDVVSAIEVLEHVPDPENVLSEMVRVGRRYLLVSVPREPIWRALNMVRGAYLRDLGNTPGHIQHWSRRGFLNLLSKHGRVEEVRTPLPWTMALVRIGSKAEKA